MDLFRPHATAQFRREFTVEDGGVTVAPRFSPYLFCAFCAFLRLFLFSTGYLADAKNVSTSGLVGFASAAP
jgi:hypothetical protein